MSEATITSVLPLRLLNLSSVWCCRGLTPEVVAMFLRIFWDRLNPLRGPARSMARFPIPVVTSWKVTGGRVHSGQVDVQCIFLWEVHFDGSSILVVKAGDLVEAMTDDSFHLAPVSSAGKQSKDPITNFEAGLLDALIIVVLVPALSSLNLSSC